MILKSFLVLKRKLKLEHWCNKEKEILMNIGKLAGFQASTNAQLIPIRELELFSMRVKVENDESIASADKQAKLAELDTKLAALKK